MVGTAFTPPPGGGSNSPIYISTDGGGTWTLNPIVPGANAITGTGDITVRFPMNGGRRLYAGTLRGGAGLTLNVLRTNDFTSAPQMTLLVTRTSEDQPYIQATTVLGGAGRGNDRVYIGHNDFNNSPRTASIEQSLDAAAAVPVFTTPRLEVRTTSGQDQPPIRTAIHPDGTVYAIYYRRTANVTGGNTCDVVVVRDDNWGIGAAPFSDLIDPGDGCQGRLVVEEVFVPWANFNQANFGQERFVGSNLSIAVDPLNSEHVYIAWAERPIGTTNYDLHVWRSTDGGENWFDGDLRVIPNATNPALAISIRGEVGFLYQQLTNSRTNWSTQLDLTTDDFTTVTTQVLASVPTTTSLNLTQCNGDYDHLLAFGKNFYGIFSADNTPNNANFPNGVTYARNSNFTTNTLLGIDNVTPIPPSIDPYFFRSFRQADEDDFYVRDWTISSTNRDIGQEPSIEPVFYNRSDVWNKRSNFAGSFNANDQPVSEDPQPSISGTNYAFCRVHRKSPGPAENVTLHFLKSEFGTGSNYQNAGTDPDPVINFGPTDVAQTMGAGYNWDLLATTSTHTCLAVEISSTNDPILGSSLLGNAPGWPTTDLMVINDNNKGQRNMGVYSGGGSGSVSYYAIVHNPAVFARDIRILLEVPPEIKKWIRQPRITVVSERGTKNELGENSVTLFNMQPGENRWVSLTINYNSSMEEGISLPVSFHEVYKNQIINGFTISPVVSSPKIMMHENLLFQSGLLERVHLLFNNPEAGDLAKKTSEAAKGGPILQKSYRDLLLSEANFTTALVKGLISRNNGVDPFGISDAIEKWERILKGNKWNNLPTSHSDLLHKLDAFLTMLQKKEGDQADILQNVRWGKYLFTEKASLKNLPPAAELINQSEKFIKGYQSTITGNDKYQEFIKLMLPLFEKTAFSLSGTVDLEMELATIKRSSGSLEALQKAHWNFLYKLSLLN